MASPLLFHPCASVSERWKTVRLLRRSRRSCCCLARCRNWCASVSSGWYSWGHEEDFLVVAVLVPEEANAVVFNVSSLAGSEDTRSVNLEMESLATIEEASVSHSPKLSLRFLGIRGMDRS